MERRSALVSTTPLVSRTTLAPGKPLERQAMPASRQPLERRTALESRKDISPGTPGPCSAIDRRSSKGRAADIEYEKASKQYLATHLQCEHCLDLFHLGEIGKHDIKRSTEVHHVAGKLGSLLVDQRLFMAVNYQCHTIYADSIHEKGELSYERGWLISKGMDLQTKLSTFIEKRGHFPHMRAKAARILQSLQESEEPITAD